MEREKIFSEITREVYEDLANIRTQTNQIHGDLEELKNVILQTVQLASQDSSVNIKKVLQPEIQSMETKISENINVLVSVHGKILQELKIFRDEQRLVGLWEESTINLDNFENWFKGVAQCFFTLETGHLEQFQTLCDSLNIQPMYSATWAKKEIEQLQKAVVKESLAIEIQPNQLTDNLTANEEGNSQNRMEIRPMSRQQTVIQPAAMGLFKIIQFSLNRERQMVAELSLSDTNADSNIPNSAITREKTFFAEIAREVDADLTNIHIQHGKIHGGLEELKNIINQTSHHDSKHSAVEMQAMLQSRMQSMEIKIFENINALVAVHAKILLELKVFKDEQRLVSLGKKSDKNLDNFETWFHSLAQCFFTLETGTGHLEQYQILCASLNFQPEYSAAWAKIIIERLRIDMIKECLVIENQPKQVIRIGTNFGGVRLRILPCYTNTTTIVSMDAVFINNDTANEVCQLDQHENRPRRAASFNFEARLTSRRGEQRYKRSIIEYSKLIATKNCRRCSEDEERMGIQEKYWIYFRVKVNWHEDALWALSLPIWVTTHPSQEPKVWSQVIWYNAFPTENRIHPGLAVPQEIDSGWLIEAINLLFVGLGRELSEEQKTYLKEIMFGGQIPSNEIINKREFDASVNSGTIPFGEWICYCWHILLWKRSNSKSKLEGLESFWADGKIIGFMGKQEIENKLRDAQVRGTFLIRFPENRPDLIGLYFYNYKDPNQKLVKMVYSVRDFRDKPLEERILENPVATHLYSNYRVETNGHILDKKQVFQKSEDFENGNVSGDEEFRPSLREYFPRSFLELFNE